MNKELLVFSDAWSLAGWLGVLVLLGLFWRGGELARLKEVSRLNLFLGVAVALMVLWQIRTGIRPGLSFHLLGASVATLMFGFWRGWLAAALAAVATALAGKSGLPALGIEILVFCALPAAVTYQVFKLVDRRLPNHFFIYVLVNGFFSAALAVGMVAVASTLVLLLSGLYQAGYLLEHYMPYFMLLSWSEAFTTGMIVTLLAVYQPEWLETFDDSRYIKNK